MPPLVPLIDHIGERGASLFKRGSFEVSTTKSDKTESLVKIFHSTITSLSVSIQTLAPQLNGLSGR